MQQKLAEKEKARKEENLRQLAQRAREERGGLAGSSKPAIDSASAMKGALAGYGSDDDSAASSRGRSRSRSGSRSPRSERGAGPRDEEDEAEDAAKVRDEMRREKRYDRERDMRMSNMGTEQRAKILAR
jgi:SNW domain-containing protein 1